MAAVLYFNVGVFVIITEILICLASQTYVNYTYVTFKHGMSNWGTPFVYLLVYTGIVVTQVRLSGDI